MATIIPIIAAMTPPPTTRQGLFCRSRYIGSRSTGSAQNRNYLIGLRLIEANPIELEAKGNAIGS